VKAGFAKQRSAKASNRSIFQKATAVIKGKYAIDGVAIRLGVKRSFEGPFVLRVGKQNGEWAVLKCSAPQVMMGIFFRWFDHHQRPSS
jgi:hypothetical protein